jgi:hypothetical protein
MSESHPIAELNMKALVGALTVMKAFCTHINLHQATMLPIVILPSAVTAYTVSPWNNTQSCGWALGGASASDAKSTPEQCHGDKCDPATPDTANNNKSSSHQKQKKPKRGIKVDTAAKERNNLGMFYLRNQSINPSKVFPKVMPKMVYATFTCKGGKCNTTSCDVTHPRKLTELKHETIIAMANHFNNNNIGWFNKYHFMRMPDMTDGIKKLLGNTKSPSSKTA